MLHFSARAAQLSYAASLVESEAVVNMVREVAEVEAEMRAAVQRRDREAKADLLKEARRYAAEARLHAKEAREVCVAKQAHAKKAREYANKAREYANKAEDDAERAKKKKDELEKCAQLRGRDDAKATRIVWGKVHVLHRSPDRSV